MLLSVEIKTKAIRTEDEFSNVSQSWYLLLFAANNAENGEFFSSVSSRRIQLRSYLTRTRESTLCI